MWEPLPKSTPVLCLVPCHLGLASFSLVFPWYMAFFSLLSNCSHRKLCLPLFLAEMSSNVVISTNLLFLMTLKHCPAGVNFPDHQITNRVTSAFHVAGTSICWLMRNTMKGRETILGQQVRGADIDYVVQSCMYVSHCKNFNRKRGRITALTSLIVIIYLF